MTLIVTFYAGPGTGKSTTNALVFGALKQKGYNVEMSHEYAKELVWEERHKALNYQPGIIGKQMARERRLTGKVDAILTDTSTLFSFVFGDESQGVTPAFKAWVLDEYRRADRLDYFLIRDHSRKFNPSGRRQKTLEEAAVADQEILNLLEEHDIPYTPVAVDVGTDNYINGIVNDIERRLQGPARCQVLEDK